VIEGAGTDANEDFVVARFGSGSVLVLQNRWVAVLVEHDGFQVAPPVGNSKLQGEFTC